MKKTVLVILALVIALTLVIGSISAVSAAKPGTVRVTGVTLNQENIYIAVGSTGTLTATINPPNATNQKVSWTSSSRKIATVGRSGLTTTVTSVAIGTATVTVKTADGRFTDTCTVYVTTPLTGIGAISGTPVVGQTLTAGALSPAGATATYQWKNCSTVDGTYTDISGATSNTYVLDASDLEKYIKVSATGSGIYTGTLTSAPTAQVKTALISIGAISGTPVVGETLTAGALSPAGATATYQWQKSYYSSGTSTDISGATLNTYVLAATDMGYYIRVKATGSGAYTGTVTSAATALVKTLLTGIGDISGTPVVGQTLTAGALSPEYATATYQWKRADAAGGTYADITGATSNTYILDSADMGKYIKVSATGTIVYTGTVTSNATAQVTTPLAGIGAISGTPAIDETLTAGALSPEGATATYQWQRADTVGGNYTDISEATSNTYTLVTADGGKYVRVAATGSGLYSGTVTSAAVWVIPSGTLFAEDFTGATLISLPAGWTTERSDLVYVDEYNEAGGVAPELYIEWGDNQSYYGNYSACTPSIDATGATSTLNLSFKHMNYWWEAQTPPVPEPYSIAVEVSTDGGTTWGTTSFSYNPTADIGPETVNVDLGAYKANTIMIRWHISGYTYWTDGWYIDDIVVTGS